MVSRQRIDWPVIIGQDQIHAKWRDDLAPSDVVSLLHGFDDLFAIDDTDAFLRRTVEYAIERVGLMRAGLYLYDKVHDMLLGTWGTDLDGHVIDEHHAMFELGPDNRRVFERAISGEAHWTLVENCPIIDQRDHATKVMGRGWVACTPIWSARGPLAMLYSDAGTSGLPVDPIAQDRATVLCSLVSSLLDSPRHLGRSGQLLSGAESHPAVRKVVRQLSRNPALGGKELAIQCGMSLSRVARLFKAEMGASLVDYRNRLRLERFLAEVDAGGTNLLETALASGFGSYAQFHRVFRAAYGETPRAYLQERMSLRQK